MLVAADAVSWGGHLMAERPSFADVFAQNLRFVWRVIAAHGVRPGDVEDATQEVFLTVHRRLDDWDPERGALRTWLYGITVRTAANYRRLAHVRREQPTESPVHEASHHDPSDAIDQQRALARLHAALAEIAPEKRDVLVLFDLEEIAMKEVAEILGIPVKTAYTRLYAARAEVHDRLTKEGA